MMAFLTMLVYAFVNTFGITQPTPEGAARAARYVGLALLLALVGAVAVAFELRSVLRR